MKNERIQELVGQAGDHAREYVANCKRYGYYMEHNEYDLQFREKLAELIVRECSYIDFKNVTDGEFSNDDSYLISKVILQHFGVKE